MDFVAERTASNFIKKFRATTLQQSLADSRNGLQKLMESYASSSPINKTKVGGLHHLKCLPFNEEVILFPHDFKI